jgi:hypothetical protein
MNHPGLGCDPVHHATLPLDRRLEESLAALRGRESKVANHPVRIEVSEEQGGVT